MSNSSRQHGWLYLILILVGLSLGFTGPLALRRWQRASGESAPMPATTMPPPAPAAAHTPAPGVHPVIEASGGHLLGGTDGGKWVTADAIADKLTGDEEYRLYSLVDYFGKAFGSKPAKDETGDLSLTLTPALGTTKRDIIGLAGDWDPMPRLPHLDDVKRAEYRQAIADVLKKNGLAQVPINITQAILVDLQGDRQQETLLTATTPKAGYPAGPTGATGDYSVVLMLWKVNGQPHTAILSGQYFTGMASKEMPLIFSVAGLLDLNGDGHQEIIVASHYCEGGGMTVFRFDKDGVQGAFANGWGL